MLLLLQILVGLLFLLVGVSWGICIMDGQLREAREEWAAWAKRAMTAETQWALWVKKAESAKPRLMTQTEFSRWVSHYQWQFSNHNQRQRRKEKQT